MHSYTCMQTFLAICRRKKGLSGSLSSFTETFQKKTTTVRAFLIPNSFSCSKCRVSCNRTVLLDVSMCVLFYGFLLENLSWKIIISFEWLLKCSYMNMKSVSIPIMISPSQRFRSSETVGILNFHECVLCAAQMTCILQVFLEYI